MCRFVIYIGEPIPLSALLTEPHNSLVHQSFDSHERSEPLNGDGFGVAWYVPSISADAAQFRAITPAWSNLNLQHLARVTTSGCMLAHVRAASTGMAVTETNTHPFVHGRHAFMHNGEIERFVDIKRPLLDSLSQRAYRLVEGTTDSEHVFALFVDELERSQQQLSMVEALERAVGRALRLVDVTGTNTRTDLNIAVSNGEEAVVCRFASGSPAPPPSLHLHVGKLYACEDRRPRLLDAPDARCAAIVASEPLTEDASWMTVPPNHAVVIDRDRTANVRPFQPH